MAGSFGSRRWMFCLHHSRKFDDYCCEPDYKNSVSQDADVDELPDPGSDIGWKIVRIARAKLQDCWEMFVKCEKPDLQ